MRPSRVQRLFRHFPILVLFFLTLSCVAACGSDEGTRGLQPSHETATPASDEEDAMTEAERRKQSAKGIQDAEIDEFDAAGAR
jgi:hypothetical protein